MRQPIWYKVRACPTIEKFMNDMPQRFTSGEAVYQAIHTLLSAGNINFETYEHTAVRTSQEAAEIRNSPLHAGAKAMVFFGDGKPVLIVLPADRKVDTRLFKQLYGVKDLRMATPEEVEELTGVTVGAVPPFGGIFGLPHYMDATLRENDVIFFNAGMHTRSMSVQTADYERITSPVVGMFSK